MDTGQRYRTAERGSVRQIDGTGGSLKSKSLHIAGTELAVIAESEEDGAYALDRRRLSQQIVVSVQDDGSAVLHVLDHLGLLAEDPFSGLEEFQMCHTDIGDYTDIRRRDGREPAHLAEMIHAHLQDSDLVLLVHLKNGDRKPPFVVKIPQCLMHTVFLCDDRGDHLLGTSLPGASGDTDNFYIEGIPVELRDVKKRLSGGFHQDIRVIRLTEIFVGYDAERSGTDRIRDEFVCIDIRAVNGNEEIAGSDLTAVNNDAFHFPVKDGRISVISPLAGLCNIVQCEVLHGTGLLNIVLCRILR